MGRRGAQCGPPELLVLNEPETGLHPDVPPALAGLITAAATHTQIVVSRAQSLRSIRPLPSNSAPM